MKHWLLAAYILLTFILAGVGVYFMWRGDGATAVSLVIAALIAAGVQITLLMGYGSNVAK